MELVFSPKFKKAYKGANEEIRKAADKQLEYLLCDIKHPSLHAKKFDEATGLWQARVT
jgi:mRNA-degrading endonuclease RelE of RelBE toxin-antitoxin system